MPVFLLLLPGLFACSPRGKRNLEINVLVPKDSLTLRSHMFHVSGFSLQQKMFENVCQKFAFMLNMSKHSSSCPLL